MARWLIAAADLRPTGGMDIANLHLARYLALNGGVELVAHSVDPALAALPGVSVTLVRRPFQFNLLGEPFLRRTALRRVAKLLKTGGQAIVNGGNCPAPVVNWVHYVHAAFTPQAPLASALRRLKINYYHKRCLKYEAEAFRAARYIVCNSHLTARHIRDYFQIPNDRVGVVYLGGDPDQLQRITPEERRAMRATLGWDDRPVAVFVGALGDRRKGFDTLHAAWTTLCRDSSWDANLAVIGRGAELAVWRKRSAEAGMQSRIHYLGFRNDVHNVLAACDVVVHPSRYEAYGLGVHEAVCRGLPAIVSADAGVSERLTGTLDDLLLTDPEDAAALADRLRHWRTNLESYRDRVTPLAHRLRSHTWTDMAREIHEAALRL